MDKKPEEDFENMKLISVLKEAYELVYAIEKHRKETDKKIRALKKGQTTLRTKVRGFSIYKRTQSKVDTTKEKIIFRTIMCPLKDKCPKINNHRWPITQQKTTKTFGSDCIFAHHPMELRFPEALLTQLSASGQMIKSLELQKSNVKPKEVFKPTGTLFDCKGCANKSGQHMGGPCNLCRYKEMA